MKTFVTSTLHMYPGEWDMRTTPDNVPYILLPGASLAMFHMNSNELRILVKELSELADKVESEEVKRLNN